MRSIYQVNFDVVTFLANIRYNKWAPCHFDGFYYNIMVNNIIESFNALAQMAQGFLSPSSLNSLEAHYNNGFTIDEIWQVNLISRTIIMYQCFVIY